MPVCLIWCTGCFKACNKYLNRTEKTLLIVLNIPNRILLLSKTFISPSKSILEHNFKYNKYNYKKGID